MPSGRRVDEVFSNLLTNHGGWALWNKHSFADLNPGVFGYFDGDGRWKEIAHLKDDQQLHKDKWKRLQEDIEVKENPGCITWGPKLSTQVKDWKLNLGGQLIPGANISTTFMLKNGFDAGAVLVTASPIRETFTTRDRPLLEWLKNNAALVVQRYKNELNEHGLWIITRTYQTERCAVSVLGSSSAKAVIDLSINISGGISLGPGVSWSSESLGSDVNLYEDTSNGVVVMMSGYFITKRFMSNDIKIERRRENQRLFRGGSDERPQPTAFAIDTIEDGRAIQLLALKGPTEMGTLCDGGSP